MNRAKFRMLRSALAVGVVAMLATACGGGGATSPAGSGKGGDVVAQAKSEGETASKKFTPALKDLIEKAKAEGTANLFVGSAKYTADQQAMLSQAVSAYFGIDLKVQTQSLGSWPDAYQQVSQSLKAGATPQIDLWVASMDFNSQLGQNGQAASVDWAALGAPADDILKVPGADSLYIQDSVRAIIYNTNLVKKEDVPKSWEDLYDPKYTGKIASVPLPTMWPAVGLATGQQQAVDMVTKLVKDQKMALLPSLSQVQQGVADGQYSIGIGLISEPLRGKGAPIASAHVKTGVIPAGAVPLKSAPHPAAATLLAYFLTQAKAGQAAAFQVLTWVKHTNEGTEAYEIANDAGVVVAPVDFQTTVVPEWVPKFSKALGLS